ncbi:MAG: hypothetical protein ACI8PZ_001964 [Myxococcota bacterium]|jgi:hypothetical protein
MTPTPTEKTCATCGRRISWRPSLAERWEEVRNCSAACRARRLGALDRALEAAIADLLAARASDATVCPSEAARAVRPERWRPLMQRTRDAARRLVAAGQLEIVQQGRVVDASTAKGPIRLRRRR